MNTQNHGARPSRRLFRIISAALLSGLASANRSNANYLPDYALFGNTGVTFGGSDKVTGIIGSNGDIADPLANCKAGGLLGYGNFNGAGGTGMSVSGAAVFNGNVTADALSSFTSLDVGGNANVSGNVTGNLTVGQNLQFVSNYTIKGNALVGGSAVLGNGNTVDGTLGANGSVTLGAGCTVGNLVYGTSLTTGGLPHIHSQMQGTVTVQPQAVGLVTMPPATTFTSGGSNVTLAFGQNPSLAPGHYGTLNTGQGAVTFTAGNYYFSNIICPNTATTWNLNLSGGAINLFVSGDVDLNELVERVNGVAAQNQSNPALASEVYLESHGSVYLDSPDFFGTVYTPSGSITTGGDDYYLTGSLLSGQNVTLGTSTSLTYEPSAYLTSLVPEPASASLLAMYAGVLLRRRPNRRSGAIDST